MRIEAVRRETARYNDITPATFGERIGGEKPVSAAHVRMLIRTKRIRPEFVTVLNPGSRRPEYRIDPAAVDAYRRDNSLAALSAA